MPCAHNDGNCQFNVPDKDLHKYAGSVWCIYHMPLSEDGTAVPKDGFNPATFCEDIENRFLKRGIGDLSGVIFPGDASFEGQMPDPVNYSGAQFHGNAKFVSVQFRQASFAGAVFKGACSFNKASFSGKAIFLGAQFHGVSRFRETTYAGNCDFTAAHFHGGTRFMEASFAKDATFSRATFHERANFTRTQFSGAAIFKSATFKGSAAFVSATLGYTDFGGTDFAEVASFRESEFKQRVHFANCKFHDNADFAVTTESRSAMQWTSFHGSTFEKQCLFTNRRFTDTTQFTGCSFGTPPHFQGATLHQDTDFDGAVFLDTQSGGADRAYRTLKLAMEQHRSRAEEARFYALEQHSLRKLRKLKDLSRWDAGLSWIYGLIANYGQSSLRPTVTLACLWIVFAVIYAVLLSPRISPALPLSTDLLARGIGLAGGNIVRPFLAWTLDTPPSPQVPLLGYQILATMQSVLTSACVAFALLATRWRFRRG
jgi:uncharacterized protein YjbI with pentapeptide repeats